MIIQVTSENPNLLSILEKNPATFNGRQYRRHKKGVIIGHCVSEYQYDIVFQDTKYSYADHRDVGQTDHSGYCDPRAAIGVMFQSLRHLFLSREDWGLREYVWLDSQTASQLDADHETSIHFKNIMIDGTDMKRGFVLEKYFPEIKIEFVGSNQWSLTITARSIFRAANIAAIALVYLAATNKAHWWINKDMTAKYYRLFENIGKVPYFVFYIFRMIAMPQESTFEKFRPQMEALYNSENPEPIEMAYGSTQVQRVLEIARRIRPNGYVETNIVEIGCGEGDHPKKNARYMRSGLEWWATDIENFDYLNRKIGNTIRNDADFFFTQDVNMIPVLPNTTILMVEVIEHMPKADAETLIRKNLQKHNPDKLIVTTPNRDFNRYFIFDDENNKSFRHDDHHFELSQQEFRDFIRALTPKNYTLEFFGIGDKIGDESMCYGVEMIRQKEEDVSKEQEA